jgi:hypothetical protein
MAIRIEALNGFVGVEAVPVGRLSVMDVVFTH